MLFNSLVGWADISASILLVAPNVKFRPTVTIVFDEGLSVGVDIDARLCRLPEHETVITVVAITLEIYLLLI